jgi:Fe-S-cluster containining protein
LLVEAYELDVLREPRLIEAGDRHYAGRTIEDVVQELGDEYKCILLAGARPCAFLGPDNRCSIYPTRPNVCVAMQAGDEQCQMAREAEGLPPLAPVD